MSLKLCLLHPEKDASRERVLSLFKDQALYFWADGQLLLLTANLENGGQLKLVGPNGDPTEGTLQLTMTVENGRTLLIPGTNFLVYPEE